MFVDPSLDVAQQRKAYGKLLEDFVSLTKHPAWQVMCQHLEAEENRIMARMADIKESDTALQTVAMLGTIRRIRQLPETTAQMAAAAIEQLK